METRVSSATKEVIIGEGHPTVLIGERINPTGKKRMAEALRAGDMDIICQEAVQQVLDGADIIDVNVSTPGVNEVSLLPKAVLAIMEAVDVPLCIDSSNPDALTAALKVYTGKPLINSVNGETASLNKILPVIKEYGAAVIGLTQDNEGIPVDAEKRIAVAEKIVQQAKAVGIPHEDVVIDCMAMAIGAVPGAGLVTLDAIKGIKERLGTNQTLGASNISFGLPDRNLINYAFLATTIAAGITCPIVNVAKVRPIILATDLVLNHDKRARRYIENYRKQQTQG